MKKYHETNPDSHILLYIQEIYNIYEMLKIGWNQSVLATNPSHTPVQQTIRRNTARI